MGLTEDELPDIVSRWRGANPRIRDFWYSVGGAATSVMQTAQPVGLPHGIVFARECNLLYGYDYLTICFPAAAGYFTRSHTLRKTNSGGRLSIIGRR